ncbi:MAG: AAA family ATPase [Chloroflexota bacterium]
MAERESHQLRITHFSLENWRNFARVDVDLQRRVFLVGPNAAGKSNLLDALRFLHDIVSVGGGFQEAVRRRGGVSRVRCLAARRYPDVRIRVRLGNEEDAQLWEYDIQFGQDNQRRPLVKHERVTHAGAQILQRPDDEDRADEDRLTQTFLEQLNANRDFRPISDLFRSIRYLHVVPQLVREPDRSVGKANDPYGGDFLEQVTRTNEKTRTSRLGRIRDALRVAVPQLQEIELHRDERGIPHVRGRYSHWRPTGAWQSEDQFSDGTLRLMGLLWAVLDGSGPLLLEEPELSLHPGVVRVLPQMLARVQRRANRQVICSTHSSDLLSDTGIAPDEVLVLKPSTEGTTIVPVSQMDDVVALLASGLSVADAILPITEPEDTHRLTLLGR